MSFCTVSQSVLVVYPEAKVEEGNKGLLLKPSKPHIAQTAKPSGRSKIENESTPAFSTSPLEANPIKPVIIPVAAESRVIRLSTETYEKAKKVAPGFDIYALEQDWREWIANKEKPKDPDAAFIGFCRRKYQNNNKS